jgi:hypothetical protein
MRFRANPVRILSLVVLLAVTNVFVFANGATSSAKNASAKVLLGKLITMSNRPILVNGGEAITGTTILSGAQIVTPGASLATVQLDNLGTVMIAPSSNVTINFDLKTVTVKVASGDATVTTVAGVKGTVIGPDGTPAPAPAPAPAPSSNGGFDKGDIAGVVIGGAGLIVGLVAWNHASNADDDAAAAAAAAAAANASLASLKACLAGQTASPVKLCTSF